MMRAIHVPADRREAVNEAIGSDWEWWPGMLAATDDTVPEAARSEVVRVETWHA